MKSAVVVLQSIMDKKNYIVPACSVLDLGLEGLVANLNQYVSGETIDSESSDSNGNGGYLSSGFDSSNAWSYEWGE